LVILFSFFFEFAFAQSFQTGLDRRVVPIQGQVTVFCQMSTGEEQRADFICRDRIMEPSPYDFFIGQRFPNERNLSIELLARDAQGGLRTKTSAYSGQLGKSEERINLWISSPFQKPLLRLGRNWVQYRIMNRQNAVLSQGEVISDVNLVASRSCPRTVYNSTNSNDCISQYTVCQQYFEQYNFCN
jgi:hypothetical protein